MTEIEFVCVREREEKKGGGREREGKNRGREGEEKASEIRLSLILAGFYG